MGCLWFHPRSLEMPLPHHSVATELGSAGPPRSWGGGNRELSGSRGRILQLVQSNGTSPTSHDLIREVAMQGATEPRHGTEQLYHRRGIAFLSGVSWHGAGSHCTWLDRKARSGSKGCKENRIDAGEQREQPAPSGAITAK